MEYFPFVSHYADWLGLVAAVAATRVKSTHKDLRLAEETMEEELHLRQICEREGLQNKVTKCNEFFFQLKTQNTWNVIRWKY